MNDIYFTTKIATENTFCNRGDEKTLISQNVKKNQHTVIVAPRRYGKTSLAIHALNALKQPYARVDFFCVVYQEDVCRKIAAAVSMLIRKIASFSEKTLKTIEQCFKRVSIRIKAGHIDLNVEFSQAKNDPLEQFEDLLSGLEKLANKHKKPVVLFLDEFQDVLKVDEANKLQAVIRSVAQYSKYVTYIFSGSSRKMLSSIFDDRTQPLYMLCSKIHLQRISDKHFKQHIKKSAYKTWNFPIEDSVVDEILTLTELHPFYVNMLCDKLLNYEYPPLIKNVKECWEQCLFENRGKIISDLEPLNTNRTKVLTVTALLGVINEPNSKLFIEKVKLPLASTQHAVKYLLDHDYLYESNEGLKLVDPLIKKFIVDRS